MTVMRKDDFFPTQDAHFPVSVICEFVGATGTGQRSAEQERGGFGWCVDGDLWSVRSATWDVERVRWDAVGRVVAGS